MDHIASPINRRGLLGRGGLAAAGLLAGTRLVGTPPAAGARAADRPSKNDRIPRDARPGGAYDRFVAKLAAEDRFSGVVLLAHGGRTVLSRSYGMADKERRIRNHEDVAFVLSSASQPFLAVAVMQLVQAGKLTLADTVGMHLTGFQKEIADQVTVHHLLTTTAGLSAPNLDPKRTFHSKGEVRGHHRQWTRQAKLVHAPGASNAGHTDSGGAELAIAAQIVEAVSGATYWDHVQEHVFRRAGMTRSGFYTRPRWLRDRHIAHAYMQQPGGERVDAVRNLDTDSLSMQGPHENPGRSFVGSASGNAFATAPDLVRFAHALYDGTLLDRPFLDVLTGAKLPGHGPRSFEGYTMPLSVVRGPQWVLGRGGGTGGSSASWSIYPDTGWVGVVLSNYDEIPFLDILQREVNAITGEPIPAPGGGGG